MHCLWLTRQDPRPADSGELIYSRGLLHALSEHGAVDVTVLAHRAPLGPPDSTCPGRISYRIGGTVPDKSLRSLLSGLPSDACRLGNPAMRAALLEMLASRAWDWVVIDQAACGWALDLLPPAHLPPQPPCPRLAYVAHNHEASLRREVAAGHRGPLPLRLALRRDAEKYARVEQRLCRAADLITAITPRDRDTFAREFPTKHIVCLPPGYEGPPPPAAPTPITQQTPRRVVLTGAFQWLAKRHNLETFLTAAAQPFRAAGIEFLVVGKADPAYFTALSRRYPWARFVPNVPAMDPYLRDARVGLIPEALGGGFKLKALDYIFRGLPLAAIDSALSGLPVDPARDAITAPDPAALAAAVAARIDDLAFLNSAASRALDACRGAFRWEDRGRTLAAALQSTP